MNRYEMEPILNPTGRFVIYGDAMHTIEKLEAQVAALKSAGRTARDDATSALDLLSRVRFALGDNGTRMQAELLEYCRELAALPGRVAELEDLLTSVTPAKDAEGIILKAKQTLGGKPGDSLIQLCLEAVNEINHLKGGVALLKQKVRDLRHLDHEC